MEARSLLTSLVPGEIVSGSINESSEVDTWTFTGSDGDLVELITTSTPLEDGFLAFAEVFAPSGSKVNGFFPLQNRQLRLDETGTYTLQISDNNLVQTGSYTIGLERIRPGSPNSTPLIPGGIVSGTIDSTIEKDQWTFRGEPGQIVQLITTNTPLEDGFLTFAEIFAPSGTKVAGFFSLDDRQLRLDESGTYTLQIRDNNFVETGDYTIGLELINPISPDAESLIPGGIVSGEIGTITEKDQWTFEGITGQRIELITTSTPLEAGFSAFVDLYAPSGSRVNGFFGLDNKQLRLDESGTYMVQIRDNNFVETGDYTIGLELINPISPDAESLIPGGIVSGEIETTIEKDQWTFEGIEGQLIELITTSTPLEDRYSAFVDVYAPSGSRVTGFFAKDNRRLRLDETGTYMVQIRDNDFAETGRYTIGFERLRPASPDAQALIPGNTVEGTIDSSLEKDQWIFRGISGQEVELTLTSIAVQDRFSAFVDVFAPSGARITGFFAGQPREVQLNETGIFLVQVRDNDFSETGRYTLTLNGGLATAEGDINGDGVADFVTGAGPGGGPHVRAFSGTDGRALMGFFAYNGGFKGGVNVATGDVNGDGVTDIITGAGPGGGPHVKVFSGVDGSELYSFFAYNGGFKGGVHVASGDIDGDGFDDIITGAGETGGPHVRVISGQDGTELRSFFAYAGGFFGGVKVGSGDINGDGRDDIITGAGPGGGPHVKVYSGVDHQVIRSFLAYNGGFPGGVNVSAGDVNGDGYDDIITGAGPGGGPHVKVYSGINNLVIHSFFAYAGGFRGGVHVAARDINGDGKDEIITGAGPGGGAHVRVIDAVTDLNLYSFIAYGGFRGGVTVAG